MKALVVEIAGVRIALEGATASLAARLRRRYQAFLRPGPADFRIELGEAGEEPHVPPGAPRLERTDARRFGLHWGALRAELDFAAGQGIACVPAAVQVVDSLVRMTMTLLLVERGALLLHACGVRSRAGALVGFGPSGSGKTTVARQVRPEDVLCDEIVAVSSEGWAAGTPFHGDYARTAPHRDPIGALVRLRHGDPAAEDRLVPLSPAQAARELLGSALFFCTDDGLAGRVLETAARIAEQTPIFVLHFRRETHVSKFLESRIAPEADATAAPARAGR